MAGSQAEPWQDLSAERGFASPSPSPQPPVSLLLLQAQEPACGPVPGVRLCGSSCPQQAHVMLWVLVPGCWSFLKSQVSQFIPFEVFTDSPRAQVSVVLRSAGLLPGTVQELFSFHSELRHKQLLSAALSVTAELGPGVSQPPGTERDLPILPAAEAGARLTPRSVFSAAFLQLLVSSLNFSVPFFHSFFFVSLLSTSWLHPCQ